MQPIFLFSYMLSERDKNPFIEKLKRKQEENIMRKKMYAVIMAVVLAATGAAGCAGRENTETETVTVQTEPHGDTAILYPQEGASSDMEGGKIAVNFEGRVVNTEGNTVELENGKKILISDDTKITAPENGSTEIKKGDYIQGYAQDPEEEQIHAKVILITVL